MRITDKYVFFWGEEFSNFYPCQIVFGNNIFSSSEQMFMYLKAKHFKDEEMANKILNTNNPKEAKKLGRKISNFDPIIWDKDKVTIMYKCVIAKFRQNLQLKNLLLKYKDKFFVEASPYDKIWGVGLGENDPLIDAEKNWLGENLLGKVLNMCKENLEQ